MPTDALTNELVSFVQSRYAKLADPAQAVPMAAYLKTDMPFYGIPTPVRQPIYRELRQRFEITNQAQYKRVIVALWDLPHREEKYAALFVACKYEKFIRPSLIPLYKRLIKEGAWWDLVDTIAIDLIGRVYGENREEVKPTIEAWIDDAHMWVRRTALICRIKHKKQTDWEQLQRHCLRRAHEKEFFIRKAIGWALREYAHTDPDAVRAFLIRDGSQLSPLSFREAAKHLDLPAR